MTGTGGDRFHGIPGNSGGSRRSEGDGGGGGEVEKDMAG